MSTTVPVSLFKHIEDNIPQAAIFTLEEARGLLTKHDIRPHKDGPLWSPTIYRNGSKRGSDGVQAITALVYDVDHDVDYTAIREQVEGYECVIHSTFRSTPTAPRLRIVVFLSRPVSAIEYPEVRARAAHLLHLNADPATKDLARFYYLPSCPPDALKFAEHHTGQLLDIDALPAILGRASIIGEFTPPAPIVQGVIPHGAQHHTLVSIGGSMRKRGLNVGEIEATLQVVNETRCEVPGSRENIRKIAESVCKYPAGELVEYVPVIGDMADAEPEDEATRPRYILHWADEALGEIPPIDWVVDELFARGSVSLVVGNPGTKKTYAMLDCAACVAMGEPWLGRLTQAGTVLVIDEESGDRRLKRRLKRILRGHRLGMGVPIAHTSLELFNLLSSPVDVQYINSIMAQLQPALVIVDALADVMPGGDENAVRDTHPIFQKLRTLAERHNCAVAVIHHAGKGGTYRGSSAIAGAVDLLLMVDSEQGSNTIVFKMEKPRDTEPQTFGAQIIFDEAMGTTRLINYAVDPGQTQLSKSMQYVVDYLKTHGRRALLEDIANAADNCTPATARRSVYLLTDKKIVRRTDSGKTGEKATYELC